MGLWAIVPVKPLSSGKSRLSGVLSQDQRALLNYAMLENTLKVLAKVKSVGRILVVSRDPSALALARENGARTVQEDGTPDLNMALRRATIVAQTYTARGVLILPADLPLISPADIEQFLQRGRNPPEVIIAPDRRMDGTNALFVNPSGLIDYYFGPGSFHKHLESARACGARTEICDLPSLEFDVDLPEDLETLKHFDADDSTIKKPQHKTSFFKKINHLLEAK